MLLSTVEPIPGLAIVGGGTLIQARVCRQIKLSTGDTNATIVSDALPFLEYELYRQLLVKMKVMGVNAVFRLDKQLQIGNSAIIGVITGTAMYLPALPMPPALRISRNIEVKDEEDRRLVELQEKLEDLSSKNRKKFQEAPISSIPHISHSFNPIRKLSRSSPRVSPRNSSPRLTKKHSTDLPKKEPGDDTSSSSSSDDSSSESGDDISDLFSDNKEAFVLEVDDETDEDIMSVLLEQQLPRGVSICNTEHLPGSTDSGSNIHMILAMRRMRWEESNLRNTRRNQAFSQIFQDLSKAFPRTPKWQPILLCWLSAPARRAHCNGLPQSNLPDLCEPHQIGRAS